MPLERPRRLPVTDPIWQRYFADLQDRTGTTDTDYTKEDRFLAVTTLDSSSKTRGLRRDLTVAEAALVAVEVDLVALHFQLGF